MRWFVRQSIKGGRVCSFNQYYKSKHCDDILKVINKELAVKGTVKILSKHTWNIKTNIIKYLTKNKKVNLMIIEMKM